MHGAHCGDLLETVRQEENCQSDPRSSCLCHQNEKMCIYRHDDDHTLPSCRGVEMDIVIYRFGC